MQRNAPAPSPGIMQIATFSRPAGVTGSLHAVQRVLNDAANVQRGGLAAFQVRVHRSYAQSVPLLRARLELLGQQVLKPGAPGWHQCQCSSSHFREADLDCNGTGIKLESRSSGLHFFLKSLKGRRLPNSCPDRIVF
jgi:hypothetical protein